MKPLLVYQHCPLFKRNHVKLDIKIEEELLEMTTEEAQELEIKSNLDEKLQGVAEAVTPDQKLQSSVLYHGTSTTAGYRGIANQGLKIDPKLIAQKYKGQENFAPLPGVYMTKEFGNAVRYSFMSNVPDEQYAEYIKQEPNGYVFEFLGKDLTTVSPDEDELGNLLKSLVNTKNLQPNLSKIVQAVPEELRVKLQQPNVSFETIAVAGKWLVDRISDSTIQYLMKRYHNVVNYSGIKPSAVWVIPKPNERFLRDRQGTNNTHNGYFNYANKFGKKYDLTEVKQGVAEASYPGNIGMMEVARFFNMATPKEKIEFERLMNMGEKNKAWQLIQKVTGVKLQGKEFDLVAEHIVKHGSQFRLLSKKGKNLGTFPSHKAAAKHEGEVEYFKAHPKK